MRLGLFAAIGVVLTHAAHLVLANRISGAALAREQDALGHGIARLIARQAADAILVDDVVTLQELVAGASAGDGVAYCFITRDGRVMASSFRDGTPAGLAALRGPETAIVSAGAFRALDIREPILGGTAGEVRLGMDMAILSATRRELATNLGLLAAAVIALGLTAAFGVGRRVARPLAEMLRAADRFDPASDPPKLRPAGDLEIAMVAERFNQMMVRVRAAHLQQEAGLQKAAATARLVALGSLVAGVAHEVNNPLAGMKNCLRGLEGSDLSPAKRDEYLELLDEGLERVEDVMRRLLDFGRPRATTLTESTLGALARDGAALIRPVLGERHIGLVEMPGDSGRTVLADRKEVSQALLNLLLNAAHFTAEGGQIRLRYRSRPGQLGISVEDDGPGVPPHLRSRLSEPYFSTRPEGEGTGLGLAITRSIADAHGGELEFEFPERGTVATLWLREPSGALGA